MTVPSAGVVSPMLGWASSPPPPPPPPPSAGADDRGERRIGRARAFRIVGQDRVELVARDRSLVADPVDALRHGAREAGPEADRDGPAAGDRSDGHGDVDVRRVGAGGHRPLARPDGAGGKGRVRVEMVGQVDAGNRLRADVRDRDVVVDDELAARRRRGVGLRHEKLAGGDEPGRQRIVDRPVRVAGGVRPADGPGVRERGVRDRRGHGIRRVARGGRRWGEASPARR